MIFDIIFITFFLGIIALYCTFITYPAIRKNGTATFKSYKAIRVLLLPAIFLMILVYRLTEVIKYYN